MSRVEAPYIRSNNVDTGLILLGDLATASWNTSQTLSGEDLQTRATLLKYNPRNTTLESVLEKQT